MPILKLRLRVPNIPFLFNPDLIGGGVLSVDTSFITIDSDIFRADNHYNLMRGPELVTNGNFAVDDNWSKGTGWTISGGKANGNNTTGDLYQENVVESGKKYKVTYTISNYVSGSVRVELSNNAYAGIERSANGTYTETILSGSTTVLFDARTSFTGSIDNVSVTEDKTFGPELVTNGDFGTIGSITTTSYSLGYVLGNSNDLGVSIVNNALVLDKPSETDTDYARVYLTNGASTSFFPANSNGKKFKLQFEIKSKSGQISFKYFHNGYVSLGDLDVGIHTIDFVKEGSSILVFKNDSFTDSSVTIDNVSVKEDRSLNIL